MTLLGDKNWYLPRWLGWLPNLQLEGAPAAMRPCRGRRLRRRLIMSRFEIERNASQCQAAHRHKEN